MAERVEQHREVEAAEYEGEQPARDLSGLPKLIISVAAVAVSLYALLWVVRPQPAQPYRTSFLAVTLAMTLLAYRPLARLYNNLTQVATVKGKGIESVEDLRGKRVSVGSPGSGTEVIALRVLEAAGLDPDDDIQRQQLGVGESVQAVKDGALDAFFWSGGVPTSAVTDLATTRELLLLPTDQYVDKLKERYGDFYADAEIEAGGYEGVDAPVKVVAVPNYLVVNRSMDPELAYRLTKLLFDQQKALEEVHPAARRLKLDTAPEVAPLELHPGARRYYDEQAKT
jgi:hypothetical protein